MFVCDSADVAVLGVILTRRGVDFQVKISAITITNSAWAIKIIECREKLQSNNQVIASQDWVTLNLVENCVFSVRWRLRRHFAGAAAAAGKRHPARRRRLIKTGADY